MTIKKSGQLNPLQRGLTTPIVTFVILIQSLKDLHKRRTFRGMGNDFLKLTVRWSLWRWFSTRLMSSSMLRLLCLRSTLLTVLSSLSLSSYGFRLNIFIMRSSGKYPSSPKNCSIRISTPSKRAAVSSTLMDAPRTSTVRLSIALRGKKLLGWKIMWLCADPPNLKTSAWKQKKELLVGVVARTSQHHRSQA